MSISDNLSDTINLNIADFAQFLASQPNADTLKKEFDKAYHLARYEVKLSKMQNREWLKVNEWISDAPGLNGQASPLLHRLQSHHKNQHSYSSNRETRQ